MVGSKICGLLETELIGTGSSTGNLVCAVLIAALMTARADSIVCATAGAQGGRFTPGDRTGNLAYPVYEEAGLRPPAAKSGYATKTAPSTTRSGRAQGGP
jgi:hypothetical protein